MCVIIHKPAGVGFEEDDIRCAETNNSDGFGYMYYDPERDKIIASKSTKTDIEDIIKIFERLKDYEACFHFRFKTKGEIIDSQCHPFKVLDKKKHGVDMYFMHNGTITNAGITGNESDTQAFNRNYLKPILSKKPSLLNTKAMQELIADFISRGSKLCFMYGKGRVVKINESAGAERNGCWVSNEYSFRTGYRSSKNTQATTRTYGNNTTGNGYYNGGGNTGYATGNRGNANSSATSQGGVNTSKKEEESNNTGNEKKEFLGQEVSVGDSLWIWDHNSDSYTGDGEITELSHNCAVVKFKDEKGKEIEASFWYDDGTSFASGQGRYYAVPAYEYENERTSKTVSEKKEELSTSGAETNVVLFSPQKKKEEPPEKEEKEESEQDDTALDRDWETVFEVLSFSYS